MPMSLRTFLSAAIALLLAHQVGRAGPAEEARNANRRGLEAVARGEFDRAIAWFSEAIRLDPNSGAAFVSRARALERKGDLEGAIADCSAALRLDLQNADALRCRAKAYLNLGEIARSITD